MNYRQLHLFNWLKDKPCISIECIERQANVPNDTVRHFINDRRNIPEKHFFKVTNILSKYGFVELNEE